MQQLNTNKNSLQVSFFLLVMVFFFSCEHQQVQAKSKKGYLGVSVEELTPTMQEEYELGNRNGLLVSQVFHDSPADEAGLRRDDVIVKFNGKDVAKADDFVLLVRNVAPKSEVAIEVIRRGKVRKLMVTLGRKRRNNHNVFSFGGTHGGAAIWTGRPALGVSIQNLNEDLSLYFKGANGEGALITDVREDTPAEEAGLKAGDVIVKIDEEAVLDVEDLRDILADYESGDEVNIAYVRLGKAGSVVVELENLSSNGGSENIFYFPKGSQHQRHRDSRESLERLDDVLQLKLHKRKHDSKYEKASQI